MKLKALRYSRVICFVLFSSMAGVASAVGEPNPPSDFTATPVSATQINLSWIDNSTNETGFRIIRLSMTIPVPPKVITLGANETSYLDVGLTCETAYEYFLRAINASGDSAEAGPALAMTAACPVSGAINLPEATPAAFSTEIPAQ